MIYCFFFASQREAEEVKEVFANEPEIEQYLNEIYQPTTVDEYKKFYDGELKKLNAHTERNP
jgi:hypothetical protein